MFLMFHFPLLFKGQLGIFSRKRF